MFILYIILNQLIYLDFYIHITLFSYISLRIFSYGSLERDKIFSHVRDLFEDFFLNLDANFVSQLDQPLELKKKIYIYIIIFLFSNVIYSSY